MPTIAIDTIAIGPGRRKTEKDKIKALADSIALIGLRAQITVRPADASGKYLLVAGRHRLEACRLLGHTEITAGIIEDKLDARLWEIAENLHRSDLTAMQRNIGIGEWVKLKAQKIKQDQKDKVGQLGQPQQPADQGMSAATRELGVKRTTARRAVKIASNLTKTAQKAAERLGLDNNQKALEAASGVPGEYQVDILENFVKKRKARQAVKDQIAENLARPPTTSGKELFFRMLEQLDIDQRMLVRIWLLGADLETCFAEHDKAQELLRADRRSLH